MSATRLLQNYNDYTARGGLSRGDRGFSGSCARAGDSAGRPKVLDWNWLHTLPILAKKSTAMQGKHNLQREIL